MTEMKTVKNPKLFIVYGKQEGIRVTLSFDTSREVRREDVLRVDTKRDIYWIKTFNVDTCRNVDNTNNIAFSLCRKINNTESFVADTLRIVKSNVPAYNQSLFIHSVTGNPVECVVFQNTGFFPHKDKYLKVQLDSDGRYGYLPLDVVGSEYDSGLRYSEDNGKIWQISTNVMYNLMEQFFIDDNFYINTYDWNYVYTTFRKIFAGRVKRGTNCIYLTTPQLDCGITKMFMIGLDLRISWADDNDKEFQKPITLTTWNDGLNATSFGGDNKRKANAMLIKFKPRKTYKIEFYDSHGKTKYLPNEKIKGCFIFGKDIENLEEKSASYQRLIDTDSYCTCDLATSDIEHASNKMSKYYDEVQELKEKWLEYTNSKYMYNYYDVADMKVVKK